jgi:hypothetical protein
MPEPKSSTKSTARSDRARAIYASLPKDPVTHRLMKRGASPGAAGPTTPPEPAGGPAPDAPFARGRGLRRYRHRS